MTYIISDLPDSNQRPMELQSTTLPTELKSVFGVFYNTYVVCMNSLSICQGNIFIFMGYYGRSENTTKNYGNLNNLFRLLLFISFD